MGSSATGGKTCVLQSVRKAVVCKTNQNFLFPEIVLTEAICLNFWDTKVLLSAHEMYTRHESHAT